MSNPIINQLNSAKSSNLPKVQNLLSKKDELDKNFFLILEDFQRLYIASKIHNESGDAKVAFMREKSLIEKNKRNIFLLRNQVEIANSDITKEIKQLELTFNKEKNRNKELSKEAGSLKNLDRASVQMLKDKNIAYNSKIISIFNLLIGSIISGVIIYKFPST